MAVIQQARCGRGARMPWLKTLLVRKPAKVAAVALANKTARIAWKLMVSGERYDRLRTGAHAGVPAAAAAA
jgi:transposase